MAAKTSFVTLRNNANLCYLAWKRRSRYDFFFTEKCVTDIQAIYKKEGRKIFTRLNRRREKQNVGSRWTPLMHLSFKNSNLKKSKRFWNENLIEVNDYTV